MALEISKQNSAGIFHLLRNSTQNYETSENALFNADLLRLLPGIRKNLALIKVKLN